MRKFLALWVAVFSLLGFAAIAAVVALRPEEDVPVPEPQIEYIPDTLSIVSCSSFAAGHDGEYVSLFVNPGGRTSNLLYYQYQWYVWTPSRQYWIPSTLPGNNTREISFQMTSIRSEYLFACVVSYQGYQYSVVSPEMNCHLIPDNNTKSSGSIVLDYYEPFELEELDKETLLAYEEKQKERET